MRLPVILLAGGIFLTPSFARAGAHLGIGLVDEIDGVHSHVATLSWETDAAHPLEVITGYIAPRDAPAIRTPRVLFASVSKRFTWHGWFAQGGIAATTSNTDVLSRHWQFHTGIGYRHGHYTLSLRHLSDANTGGRNRGETFLLGQFAF